jgi:uncharacterized membrane protein
VSKLQWKVEIGVDAPLEKVWDAIDDLTLIPKYPPDVRHVEYLSGQTKRAPGVSYKCIVPEGRKGWCIEQVVEHIPGRKTTVAFPEDSWGLSGMFEEFLAELSVAPEEGDTTLVRLQAYYLPRGWKVGLMNALFIRRMMRKRARLTLEGFRRLVEGS